MQKTALHLTDLHLEFNRTLIDFNTVISEKRADFVFLTGDIAGGTHALPFIKHLLNLGYKVFYILGNHEFYGYEIEFLIKQWRDISSSLDNFYFLENDSVIIDDIEIFGSCLWTSMGTKNENDYVNPLFSNLVCSNKDFEVIENWNPEKMKDMFYYSWNILKQKIENSNAKTKIVLSHYLPSYQSVNPMYQRSPINAFFTSELDNYIAYSDIDFWFHGHTHESCNYHIYNTHIICNPYGYKDKNMLNKLFDWNLIVKLEGKSHV